MKRLIAILLAAVMMTGILTACSGMVGMGDGRAYGNVSTTPNGTVNGSEWYDDREYNYRDHSKDDYRYDNRTQGNGSYDTGTGMTGGR